MGVHVKVITGLNVVDAIAHDTKTFNYHKAQNSMESFSVIDDDTILETRVVVDEKVVPIFRICQAGKPDVYVAYTEEVEDFLGIPFRAINNATRAAEANATHFRQRADEWQRDAVDARGKNVQWASLPFWQRLAFMFGKLPDFAR